MRCEVAAAVRAPWGESPHPHHDTHLTFFCVLAVLSVEVSQPTYETPLSFHPTAHSSVRDAGLGGSLKELLEGGRAGVEQADDGGLSVGHDGPELLPRGLALPPQEVDVGEGEAEELEEEPPPSAPLPLPSSPPRADAPPDAALDPRTFSA